MWGVSLQSYDARGRGGIESSQSDFLDIAFVQYCIIRMNIRHIDRTSNLHAPAKHIKHFQLNFEQLILVLLRVIVRLPTRPPPIRPTHINTSRSGIVPNG